MEKEIKSEIQRLFNISKSGKRTLKRDALKSTEYSQIISKVYELTNFVEYDYDLKTRCIMIERDFKEEWKCEECGRLCTYNVYKRKRFCSRECISSNRGTYKKKIETMKKTHGVENIFQLDSTKKKIETTCLKKYGVKSPTQSEEIKNKIKKTCLEKYGSENFLSSKIHRKRMKEKMIEKYGVDHNMKSPELFLKNMNSRGAVRQYRHLLYQSEYELKFIKFIESLRLLEKLKNGPTIEYLVDNYQYSYHSDFIIEELNLIVEIKSSWYYDKNGRDFIMKKFNEAKKRACLDKGYDFIFVINNNFNEVFSKIQNMLSI